MAFTRRGSGRILTLMLVAFLALLAFLGGFWWEECQECRVCQRGKNRSGINFGIIWQIDLKATKVI